MAKCLYMHTIDRQPGYFDGYQVVFASGDVRRLCTSLRQLRREQEQSESNREADGLSSNDIILGYARVYVPDDARRTA